jgi:hypothetical protein
MKHYNNKNKNMINRRRFLSGSALASMGLLALIKVLIMLCIKMGKTS